MSKDHHAVVMQVKAISNQIRLLLAGVAPEVQGGVLGEMVGRYLAGYHHEFRAPVRDVFNEMVDGVIKMIDERPDAARRRQ